jgi:hypothetical protein
LKQRNVSRLHINTSAINVPGRTLPIAMQTKTGNVSQDEPALKVAAGNH